MKRFVSYRVFILLLSTMFFGTSWAEEYISEIAIITSIERPMSFEDLWSVLTDIGFKVIPQDLNERAKGDYVYLAYRTTTDRSKAITFIGVVKEPPIEAMGGNRIFPDSPSSYLYYNCSIALFSPAKYGGKEYQCDLATALAYDRRHYTITTPPGSTNSGTDGWPLYIFYSRDNADDPDAQFYSCLSVTSEKSGSLPCYELSDGNLTIIENEIDLNRGNGAESSDLYLHAYHKHPFRSSITSKGHSHICSACEREVSGPHWKDGEKRTFYPVDENQHMCVCSDPMCGYRSLEEHTWSNDTKVIVAATSEQCGIIEYHCSECSATRRVTVDTTDTPSVSTRSDKSIAENMQNHYVTSIEDPIEEQDAEKRINVYNLQGQCVMRGVTRAEAFEQMSLGETYIIDGKRVKIGR